VKINCPTFSVFAIVLAASEFNWLDLPKIVGNALGIGVFGGQMLLSLIVLLAVMLPTLYLSDANMVIGLFVGTLALGFLVALGWMDPLVFTLLILIAAVGWAKLIADILTGKGGL